MNSSSLVVGAGGFIGFNLCLELHKINHKVYACDNFFPETILEQLKKQNIETIEGGVEGFVISQEKYKNIDNIYYFAGNSVPALVEAELKRGCFADQEVLVMLLSSLKSMNKKVSFVFGSSGGTVYGQAQKGVCSESMLCNPISAYGLSKIMQEQFVQFFARKYHLKCYIARISNPYGRLLTHGSKNLQGFIDTVVDKVVRGKEIEIWGDGSVVRDFIYIKDLVSALSMLAEKETPSGIYNIGSGQGVSLNEIIATIESLGECLNIKLLSSRKIDVEVNILDIYKIEEQTSWVPKVSLLSGVESLLVHRKSKI